MPVLDRLVSISTGLVPEPALCPGADAAERSQETRYVEILRIMLMITSFKNEDFFKDLLKLLSVSVFIHSF